MEQSEVLVSTDRAKLDSALIHRFLQQSYWAKDISLPMVQKSIDHSLCFGVYQNDAQIGFARVITDYVRLAYLADVFILEPHRGRGIGKKLVEFILTYPELQQLRKWVLVTADAHEFYRSCGFQSLGEPDNYLEICSPSN